MTGIALAIDLAVKALVALINATGAAEKIGAVIAARISEGREWTDAERAEVERELQAQKAYARAEIDKG